MEILIITVSMLGGLALFLYGMSVMSDTLSQMTGGSLDRVIGKITQNRYIGFVAGALLTDGSGAGIPEEKRAEYIRNLYKDKYMELLK